MVQDGQNTGNCDKYRVHYALLCTFGNIKKY